MPLIPIIGVGLGGYVYGKFFDSDGLTWGKFAALSLAGALIYNRVKV